ncbi:MAG: hypothetical protein IJ600_02290 [Lachnospiraceae bacterium]|nr:hypothetical protein [Lachnospiraceae bacterium]
MPRRLLIRTEANAVTATGHMRRCLNIAEAARAQGAEPVFIVAEPVSEKLPRERGFQVVCLDRPFDAFDEEIPQMRDWLRQQGITEKTDAATLLIDSYFVSENYMRAMQEILQVAYIDDLHERIWPCDILICYGMYAADHDYAGEYPHARLLLGGDYMPLDRIYQEIPKRQIRGSLKNVLVISGGTDPVHFLPQFLELAEQQKEEWGGMQFTLIAGALDPDLPALLKRAENMPDVRISEPLPDLKAVLLDSDLVVTAAGTTLYELAATGTPGICYVLADNQILNAEAFVREGLFLFGGYIHRDGFRGELFREQFRQMREPAVRQEMSRRLQRLVDAKGAERIAKALLGVE